MFNFSKKSMWVLYGIIVFYCIVLSPAFANNKNIYTPFLTPVLEICDTFPVTFSVPNHKTFTSFEELSILFREDIKNILIKNELRSEYSDFYSDFLLMSIFDKIILSSKLDSKQKNILTDKVLKISDKLSHELINSLKDNNMEKIDQLVNCYIAFYTKFKINPLYSHIKIAQNVKTYLLNSNNESILKDNYIKFFVEFSSSENYSNVLEHLGNCQVNISKSRIHPLIIEAGISVVTSNAGAIGSMLGTACGTLEGHLANMESPKPDTDGDLYDHNSDIPGVVLEQK